MSFSSAMRSTHRCISRSSESSGRYALGCTIGPWQSKSKTECSGFGLARTLSMIGSYKPNRPLEPTAGGGWFLDSKLLSARHGSAAGRPAGGADFPNDRPRQIFPGLPFPEGGTLVRNENRQSPGGGGHGFAKGWDQSAGRFRLAGRSSFSQSPSFVLRTAEPT